MELAEAAELEVLPGVLPVSQGLAANLKRTAVIHTSWDSCSAYPAEAAVLLAGDLLDSRIRPRTVNYYHCHSTPHLPEA